MKNNKYLKFASYILIPILIVLLIITVYYQVIKDRVFDKYYEKTAFLYSYEETLYNMVQDLIFRNNMVTGIYMDGDTKIIYADYYSYKSDCKILITYKNLAITNVQLTSKTDTVEKIKNLIAESNKMYANIIDGNLETNSTVLGDNLIRYYAEIFNVNYYSIENSNKVEYETNIKDYQVYSSFSDEVAYHVDRGNVTILNNMIVDNIQNNTILSESIKFIIPITVFGILICFAYLTKYTGKDENDEKIQSKWIDKINLECYSLLIVMLIVVGFGIFEITAFSKIEIEMFISILFTELVCIYIACIEYYLSIVRRIKTKKFWSSFAIVYLINKILIKCLDMKNKFRQACTEAKSVYPNYLYEIIKDLFIFLLLFILYEIFGIVGLFIDLIIFGTYLYKALKEIDYKKKIQNKLKQICENETTEKLKENDFPNEFSIIVKYINGISEGFEKAKEEGRKSERMKTELITNVSHDIKTPLTSIINYIDLLKKEKIEDEKINEYINVLESKAQRLKKLTEDLVEASKASSGNVLVNFEKIDITELINQAIGEFEDKFNQRKLNINFKSDKNIYINADSKLMYRVIENLFSNIYKYALESSRVYIDVKYEDKVFITFKNISKDELNISAEELMQRFVRGDRSRNTEGSGLGLSISQDLTKMQNGKFKLEIDGDLFKVELEFNKI